jgi:Glyoxalase-like domain
MRLRQTVLVARDLDRVVDTLTGVLGIEVGFNDPAVAEFGLKNAVMPVGDTFLEVVSPVDPQATANRYLERRRGDGGYMLIMQCDDLDADRRRVAALGVRTVWKQDLPQIRGTHLHPKDTGGTLLSLDAATPPESWHWAGPRWQKHVARTRVDAITAAEIQSDEPRSLAARWAEILDRPAAEVSPDRHEITLDGTRLRFVTARDGRGEGLCGFDVRTVDREAVLRAARERGCPTQHDAVTIGGVRIALV